MRIATWLLVGILGGCLVTTLEYSSRAEAEEAKPEAQENVSAPRSVVAIINRGGCGNCHVIPGVPGADGNVGPDLTDLGKVAGERRSGMSAREYVRESILEPDAFVAPGDFEIGIMPTMFGKTLSREDLDSLVEYLSGLGVRESPTAEEAPQAQLSRERPSELTHEPFQPMEGELASDAALVLGKALFHDRRLSASNALSCATCHQPSKAFTDGRPVSVGYPGTDLFRNTPSLWNVSRLRSAYWDGRLSGRDLPTVMRDHLTEPFFMASDGRLLIERMKQSPEYVDLFQEAFSAEPSFGGILNSLAAYVGALHSPASPYDRHLAGEAEALSEEAQAGLRLFEGKANCARCHSGALFTDHQFHDLGLRTRWDLLHDPVREITFRRFFRGLGTPNYRNLQVDVGRYAVTLREEDRQRFRTPSLREAIHTAPYMHDGRFTTLADVIDFYDAGGGQEQSAGLQPLRMTSREKRQLLAFLQSLSSELPEVKESEAPDYGLLPRPEEPLSSRLMQPADDSSSAQAIPATQERTPRPITSLPEPPQPADNLTTPEKVELGRLLFFDARLSADGATSCNTCHPANTGYTAQTPISMGGTGTSHWRNSSGLFNVAYFEKFNWDGARGSIESQNDGAWSGAVAGNIDPELAEERLAQIPEYRQRFRDVFGDELPTWDNSLRAVAAYQRTLNSRNVPFDAYLAGDETAISESARRGYQLFLGKARCVECHDGPLLSDDRYHNLGVPPSPDFFNSPTKQITFRFEQASKGVPRALYETVQDDLGLYYVTKRPADIGKFRTPSLRELKHTAPYMHNGIFRDLHEVIAFYNQGGGTHPRKSSLMKPLELSDQEQADLLEFLESLSGDPLTDRPPAMPPYGEFPRIEEDS